MLEERVLAAMVLALGPRRARPVPGLWATCQGPTKEPDQLLAVAIRLAAARFPGTAAEAPTTFSDDPGVAAAAAFAGLPISLQVTARLLRQDGGHATLFWRGALLGEAWRFAADGTPPTHLDFATELLARRDDRLEHVRGAAILLRARAQRLDATGPPPDWRLLQLAASPLVDQPALRLWLGPVRQPRDDQPERLAVAYALLHPVDAIVAARDAWANDPRIRRPLALALSLRLAGGSSQRIDVEVPDLPEWAFVRWASGGAFGNAASFGDARLDALAQLIAAGRASPAAARATLEATLWRWRCHPGIGIWEQERLLVRDLLLGGSNPGGGRYLASVRRDQRYFPTGLDRGDPFFDVAVELYEFLAVPRPPVPSEYRLR
jgi:hypothetical protein